MVHDPEAHGDGLSGDKNKNKLTQNLNGGGSGKKNRVSGTTERSTVRSFWLSVVKSSLVV